MLVSEAFSIGIYITFSVTDVSSEKADDTPKTNPNSAFMRLMMAARLGKRNCQTVLTKVVQIISKSTIIDWLDKNNLGFSSDCENDLGKELVTTLTNTFWYINNHFKTLADRGYG